MDKKDGFLRVFQVKIDQIDDFLQQIPSFIRQTFPWQGTDRIVQWSCLSNRIKDHGARSHAIILFHLTELNEMHTLPPQDNV